MDYLEIQGQQKLSGSIKIDGSKNATLPLLASTILTNNDITITNVPDVVDINTLLKLLGMLGATYSLENNTLQINASQINTTKATYDIVKTMRASILVLGPLLARFGHCEVSLPGGCAIGQRPVDLHIKALELMGAKIEIKEGYIIANSDGPLVGTTIVFDKATVTGTENIVMAATLAIGKTTIVNAAKEPEVVQLCEVLQQNGVEINGIGTNTLEIIGKNQELIQMNEFAIIPDRIEAGTYLCAGAIANTEITITNVIPAHLTSILSKFKEMGFGFTQTDSTVTILPADVIKSINITTAEHPGFPTDMQAQFMAVATMADDTSIIDERLFENRFMHVSELKRMGAKINLHGSVATVEGNQTLIGTDIMATDLRASSALVLAALVAKGTTKIHRIYHLDRGYNKLEDKLTKIGAKIVRKQEKNG